jgi:hypothetical protein
MEDFFSKSNNEFNKQKVWMIFFIFLVDQWNCFLTVDSQVLYFIQNLAGIGFSYYHFVVHQSGFKKINIFSFWVH